MRKWHGGKYLQTVYEQSAILIKVYSNQYTDTSML